MKQVINIIIENKEIDRIRKKYDKNYGKIKSHISLVYPFEVDDGELREHINNIINNFGKFEIILRGFEKSAKEYYLYLLIDKGNEKIIELYKKFNSGILSGFKNKDMPVYIPHVTLGVFNSEEEINKAVQELEKQKIKIKFFVDKINLLTLNGDFSINKQEDFQLKL